MTIDQLRDIIASAPHLSTKRGLYQADLDALLRAIPSAKRRVRSYSADGFVPGSYRWRCEIQFVEWTEDSGFTVGWTGAQRSRGKGALLVIR